MGSLMQSVVRSVIGLGLFAIITSGLIATTQSVTKDTIAEQVKKAQSKALIQIVPLSEHNNDLLSDTVQLDEGGLLNLSHVADAYIARNDDEAVAVILPVIAPNGYSGPIKMIVGIDVTGKVKGVRVVGHKETPGLGDKIDIKKSDWITHFNGKSLASHTDDQWKVKKDGGDFDQLTGATITPRAVVAGVHNSLLFFKQNQHALFNKAHAVNKKNEGDESGH
jgi:electron transport complex protein RnfG